MQWSGGPLPHTLERRPRVGRRPDPAALGPDLADGGRRRGQAAAGRAGRRRLLPPGQNRGGASAGAGAGDGARQPMGSAGSRWVARGLF